MSSRPLFAVLGAGSWGTALALHLAHAGHEVMLWARDKAQVDAMLAAGENAKYLAGHAFPNCLIPTSDLATAMQAQYVLINVPSRAFEGLLERIKPLVTPNTKLLSATKGLSSKGELLTEVVREYFADRDFAILSGPSFAKEVARQLPTVVNIASDNEVYAKQLADYFSTDTFRVYTNLDIVGVQLGGAVKNVLAVAVGVSDGLGFGVNARSGLMTRGLAEMMRLGKVLGAHEKTLTGLSGLGDLILTCTDDQSRNRRFGLAIGSGKNTLEAKQSIGQEVESVHTVEQVMKLANQYQVDMPITAQVQALVKGDILPLQAVKNLFNRALRSE